MTDTLDGEPRPDLYVPACARCAHWRDGTDRCKAFPRGIPDEVWLHGNDHTGAVPGDNGIRFEEPEE